MNYLISLLLFLSLNNQLICQDLDKYEKAKFSFGLTFGYKTDAGSFALQFGYLIKHIIGVNIHVGANKFEGPGIGIGVKGFLFPNEKFKPYFGITYDNHDSHGNGFSIQTDSSITNYTRGINNILLFHIGLLYEERPGSIFVSLNYKSTFPGNHLILRSGPPNPNQENLAQKVYSPGLGVTVGIIFHWWGHTHTKSVRNAQF